MKIGQPMSSLLFAASGVAGGWLLFHWGASDPAAAQPQPAALSQTAPAIAPPPQTITVVVVPANGTAQTATIDKAAITKTVVERVLRPIVKVVPGPAAATAPAIHNQVIVAQDGSIIVVGDQANLTANTGDTSSSGTVVLNSQDSTVSTGTSTLTLDSPAPPDSTATGATTSGSTTAAFPSTASASAGGSTTSGTPSSRSRPAVEQLSTGGSSTSGASVATPTGNSVGDVDPIVAALGNALALQFSNRPVALAGYEDHSVSLFGNDQIVTYDDSNVFINRNGQLNSNTGDTDSAGLNAVDVIDSVIRSGDHNEDGPDDGDDEEEEEPEEEDLTARFAPTADRLATTAASNGESATSTDPDASSTATGNDPLVIGADGYDDVSIRTTGNRNIVTYDDSNVIIGGTGNVNAQIGDSDTSGVVVMGIRGSDVRSGSST